MDEGDGLENRRPKGPWVRILPPPPLNLSGSVTYSPLITLPVSSVLIIE